VGVWGTGCGRTLGAFGWGLLGVFGPPGAGAGRVVGVPGAGAGRVVGVPGAGAGRVVGVCWFPGAGAVGVAGVVTPGLVFGVCGADVASALVEMLRIIVPVTATEVRSLICLFISLSPYAVM